MSTKATTVLTSIVETVEQHDGWSSVSFNMGGEPHAAAIVNAVVGAYPRTDADLEALAAVRTKVTLVTYGEGMLGASSINVEEVSLVLFNGVRLGYLPKGARNKGFRLDPARVLDVLVGWGKDKVAEATQRVLDVRARFPQLVPLTKQRLAELPVRSDTASLAVFGTWRSPSGARATDALWLISSYDPDGDIAEGVLFVRPESDGTSEYGSVYGKDLLRFGGEVEGFVPISYADAVALTDESHDVVLAAVLGVEVTV